MISQETDVPARDSSQFSTSRLDPPNTLCHSSQISSILNVLTLGTQLYVQPKQRDHSNQSDAVIMRCFIAVQFCCFVMFSKYTCLSFCIAVTQMYYALFIINKLLTSVCNINHSVSVVYKRLYIVQLFIFLCYFFKSLNGRDSGKLS